MDNVDEIRSALREFKRVVKEQLESIAMLDEEIRTCERAYYSCEETDVQASIIQRRQQCINARERLIMEFRGIQENVNKLRVIVLSKIKTKEKNFSLLQELPQFGNVSSQKFINVELNSISEWNILLSEIDAFLDGDYSDDSTNTYGQKTL